MRVWGSIAGPMGSPFPGHGWRDAVLGVLCPGQRVSITGRSGSRGPPAALRYALWYRGYSTQRPGSTKPPTSRAQSRPKTSVGAELKLFCRAACCPPETLYHCGQELRFGKGVWGEAGEWAGCSWGGGRAVLGLAEPPAQAALEGAPLPAPCVRACVQACTHVSGHVFAHVCLRIPSIMTAPSSSLPSYGPRSCVELAGEQRDLWQIMECFALEGTCRGHPVQPPAVSRDIFSWIRVLRAPSNLAWNVSRDGVSPTSPGNPCEGFSTLMLKNAWPPHPILAAPPLPTAFIQWFSSSAVSKEQVRGLRAQLGGLRSLTGAGEGGLGARGGQAGQCQAGVSPPFCSSHPALCVGRGSGGWSLPWPDPGAVTFILAERRSPSALGSGGDIRSWVGTGSGSGPPEWERASATGKGPGESREQGRAGKEP